MSEIHREPQLVTLRRESVERAFLMSVLAAHVEDLAAREPVLLPEIGVAALDLSAAEIASLERDQNVLRVVPDERLVNVLLDGSTGGVGGSPRTRLLPPSPQPPLPAVPLNIEKIGAHHVWPCTKGAGVKVAILDSGVDAAHPQLPLADGKSFVPNQSSWNKDPWNHGTRVAGIVGARESQTSTVVGVAPECDMYSVKVISDGNEAQVSWILAGMVWAANQAMQVVCMSVRPSQWEAKGAICEVEVDRAASVVQQAGGFFAAAAGNSGLGAFKSLLWPAVCARVMAVGALDRSGNLLPITSYGPDDPDRGVEIMAPGFDVDTTANGGGYSTLSNTSAACAHVAGAAALLKAANPALGPHDIRRRLRDTADDMVPPVGRDERTGFGSLDVYEAVFLTWWSRFLCAIRVMVRRFMAVLFGPPKPVLMQ